MSDDLAHDRISWTGLVVGPASPDVLPCFLKGILCHAQIPTGLTTGKGKEAVPVGPPPALELCGRARWLHPLVLRPPIRPPLEKRMESTGFEGAATDFSDILRRAAPSAGVRRS